MSHLERHDSPGAVTAVAGKGGLPALHVHSSRSTAVIYRHGAHIASWTKKDAPPVLFLSGSSSFLPDKPIRGGVPVIFPWFGAREGHPFHATARLADWDLTESLVLDGGDVRLRFSLPGPADHSVSFVVTVGESLRMELTVINHGNTGFTFENCLHTYFTVGDIHRTEVRGLMGAAYHDQLLGRVLTDENEAIRFTAETDRIYQNTDATTEIADPALGRVIRIRKSGSLSTVVWNPWIDKARNMPDFGDEEYLGMVCVESGNVREHSITLAPGASHTLAVEIETRELV